MEVTAGIGTGSMGEAAWTARVRNAAAENVDAVAEKVSRRFLLLRYVCENRTAGTRKAWSESTGRQEKTGKAATAINGAAKRDTFAISAEALELSKQPASTAHKNRDADTAIDLQRYIDAVREENAEALAHAGTEINRNAVKCLNAIDAFRRALNDKYQKLSAAADAYGDRQAYLEDKYFNKWSPIYENDLSEKERSVGYQNEKSFLENGRVRGVDMGDSLFRGLRLDGDMLDNDRLQMERRVISRQVSNILTAAGIGAADGAVLSVDPYSYDISVNGADEETKRRMEVALNVGENGKHLFWHIKKASEQDGVDSDQRSSDALLKYQAAARVAEYADLRLDQMEERDDSFYTDRGENVLDVVDRGIAEQVPRDYRNQVREWAHGLISDVAAKGWANLPDMTLEILYTEGGLRDLHQNVIYDGKEAHGDRTWSVL